MVRVVVHAGVAPEEEHLREVAQGVEERREREPVVAEDLWVCVVFVVVGEKGGRGGGMLGSHVPAALLHGSKWGRGEEARKRAWMNIMRAQARKGM